MQHIRLLHLQCLFATLLTSSAFTAELERLKKAYPDHIASISPYAILWHDGTFMPLEKTRFKSFQKKLISPTLADQIYQDHYYAGISYRSPKTDPGRIRYEPFFCKMYGSSPAEVEQHLIEIAWMPAIFGIDAPRLKVTTINNVHLKLKSISDDLENLVMLKPDLKKYVENPGGTYRWRYIAHTQRLSAHSFGMTIDLNTNHSHYWQWDLKDRGLPISERARLSYRNAIPWDIVLIFEKYGFIWGGKWYHYDTMHFEYRPELFVKTPSPFTVRVLSDAKPGRAPGAQ